MPITDYGPVIFSLPETDQFALGSVDVCVYYGTSFMVKVSAET